jgi:hypothetical protein
MDEMDHKRLKRRREAIIKRLETMRERYGDEGMPPIKMYISRWHLDDNGIPTRILRRIDP